LDPNIILDHLALAKGHVRQGTAHVDRQRQLVKDLAHSGHDITQSKMLQRTFEELLELHIQVSRSVPRGACRGDEAIARSSNSIEEDFHQVTPEASAFGTFASWPTLVLH
jgi:hypothetical protein